MSVLLQAPAGLIQTTTILPDPDFGDKENPNSEVKIYRGMEGSTYTYVKSKAYRKLSYKFQVTRLKCFEVQNFIDAYLSTKIRLTNHRGLVFIGDIVNNPVEYTITGKRFFTYSFSANYSSGATTFVIQGKHTNTIIPMGTWLTVNGSMSQVISQVGNTLVINPGLIANVLKNDIITFHLEDVEFNLDFQGARIG